MQMLSSEICEIFKNNSFTKHLGGYFCHQNRSKETKDILRNNTLQIFLLKHNDASKYKI